MEHLSQFNSIGIAVLSVVMGMLVTAFWNRRANIRRKAEVLADTATHTDTRITALEAQLSVMRSEMTPLSEVFRAALIKQLTHFHKPEMDGLLAKMGANTLTEHEGVRLTHLLHATVDELDDQIDEGEREAALMLPFVNNRVRRQAEEPQVVVVTDIKAE